MQGETLIARIVARFDQAACGESLNHAVDRYRLHSDQSPQAVLRGFSFLGQFDQDHVLSRSQIQIGEPSIQVTMRLGKASSEQIADIVIEDIVFVELGSLRNETSGL